MTSKFFAELMELANGYVWQGPGDRMDNYTKVQSLCDEKKACEKELLIFTTALSIINEKGSSVHLLLSNYSQEGTLLDKEIVETILELHKSKTEYALEKIEEELKECIKS